MTKRKNKNKHIHKQNPLSKKYQKKPTDKFKAYSILSPKDRDESKPILDDCKK